MAIVRTIQHEIVIGSWTLVYTCKSDENIISLSLHWNDHPNPAHDAVITVEEFARLSQDILANMTPTSTPPKEDVPCAG